MGPATFDALSLELLFRCFPSGLVSILSSTLEQLWYVKLPHVANPYNLDSNYMKLTCHSRFKNIHYNIDLPLSYVTLYLYIVLLIVSNLSEERISIHT